MSNGTKKCNKCKKTLLLRAFNKATTSLDGLQHKCRECQKAYYRHKYQTDPKWAAQKRKNARASNKKNYNPIKSRDKKYRLQYGITIKDYNNLLKEQKYSCAICGKKNKLDSLGRRLHVDHNHETGEVRGLLCGQCNAGLGFFGDSIKGLKQAIKYLELKKYGQGFEIQAG